MAEFLDTAGIEEAIKKFEKCLQKKGLKVKIDPKKKEEPGLANLLYTLIEFFDKLYATVLSPYAKLIDLAKKIIQTNIDVWGEGFLIKAFLVTFVVGIVITFLFIRKK